MIQSATRLAKTLGDQPRASQLERLHLEIESRLRDMEINKNFLENLTFLSFSFLIRRSDFLSNRFKNTPGSSSTAPRASSSPGRGTQIHWGSKS